MCHDTLHSDQQCPKQLMGIVYHHTLEKLHVKPSTIGCWETPWYVCIQHIQYVQLLHINKFSLHCLIHFTLYMKNVYI